jgi:hypothetical protein
MEEGRLVGDAAHLLLRLGLSARLTSADHDTKKRYAPRTRSILDSFAKGLMA